jgi:predicted oxidoreductase (fatty acid repression mutant protein)
MLSSRSHDKVHVKILTSYIGTEHASGMLQYTIWTMLTAEGFGVSLQHYNPMVDAAAAKEWDIPADWSLKAQMVFGKPTGPRFAEKEYSPVEDRMKVYGA